ncbi:MAG: polyketide synthase, partial [Actinobacteria bacterium]|nr:polyketide synthase [Actinomycetota bacterium]
LLEVIWEALENGGYAGEALSRNKTGLFAGVSINEYAQLLARSGLHLEEHAGTGNSLSIVANRPSYLLDLTGPSLAVDTACSSSLVALDLACRYMQLGLCEQAIVGAVNLILTPITTIGFRRAGMLAPDGRCKTFDDRANGYVRGEGAGVVLLKPLGRALADGDHLWAVILGGAVNHDGRSKVGLTAPNPKAQKEVLLAAYRDAGVAPETLSYVEAHGTGTPLGDAIEVRALTDAFRASTDRTGFCRLGSVKTNLGHLEPAAGMAALIKTVLALHHAEIPPSLHVETLNSNIRFDQIPFTVNRALCAWESTGPRRAGVSSFGFGGANAHVVLES